MPDETNREAAVIARTEAAAARSPWSAPTVSCICAADAQIGPVANSNDLDFLS